MAEKENSKKSDDLWSNIESENFEIDVDVPNITKILSESDVTVRKRETIRLVSESSVEIEEPSSKIDQSYEDFKDELRTKRMRRISIVNGLRDELKLLRHQLDVEKEITRRLRNGESVDVEESPHPAEEDASEVVESADEKKTAANHHLMAELAEAQLALQLSNAENLSLTTELGYVRKQVASLKEVVGCYKEMISVKETEVNQVSHQDYFLIRTS